MVAIDGFDRVVHLSLLNLAGIGLNKSYGGSAGERWEFRRVVLHGIFLRSHESLDQQRIGFTLSCLIPSPLGPGRQLVGRLMMHPRSYRRGVAEHLLEHMKVVLTQRQWILDSEMTKVIAALEEVTWYLELCMEQW